jgi:hypothetical protein
VERLENVATKRKSVENGQKSTIFGSKIARSEAQELLDHALFQSLKHKLVSFIECVWLQLVYFPREYPVLILRQIERASKSDYFHQKSVNILLSYNIFHNSRHLILRITLSSIVTEITCLQPGARGKAVNHIQPISYPASSFVSQQPGTSSSVTARLQ